MIENIIGHKNKKRQLETAIAASRKRNVALPHMLFAGAPGCGKTSLARAITKETNSPFLSVIPNDLKDHSSVLKLLEKLNHTNYDTRGNRTGVINPTILFLDEIHNLPKKGQELLGLVMESFKIESGQTNRFHWVPFFTLIGATTLAGKLSKPFRDRFKLIFNFEIYNDVEMNEIVSHHARQLKLLMPPSAQREVAKRSRGTPRIAVGFLERIKDRVISRNSELASVPIVEETFREMGIDNEGLTKLERRILNALLEAEVPLGLDTLSVMLQEDSKSIKDYAEPYLIRKGFLIISGKGRKLTEKGLQYLRHSNDTNRLIKELIGPDYERF